MNKVRISLALVLGMLAWMACEGISRAQMAGGFVAQVGFNADDTLKNDTTDSSSPLDKLSRDDMDCCAPLCGNNCLDDICRDCCSCGPKWRFWGDFLYIRPRNAEVVYAVPFDGPVTPPPSVPIQFGRIATVDPTYEPTFRVGGAWMTSKCSSLGVSYTQLDSNTTDSISVNAPLVLRSMVIHPSTLNATANWLDAEANYDISYKVADIEYRRTFLTGCRHRVDYVLGVTYGHLKQELRTQFSSIGVESINTDINFDGGGIRLGLDAERQAACSGWLVYGRANARFLGGEFSGRYTQGNTYNAEIVDAQWKAGRVVPVLDLELGFGWASKHDCLRMTAGYMFTGWYNMVTTTDYIGAVQNNDFSGLHDTMTFDGLVIRAELRY